MTREELKAILKKEGNYKAFEYKGYKCRIIRIWFWANTEMFHLCWYVLLSEEDKYYWYDYDEIPYLAHWWITYSDKTLIYQPEEWRWIGFDCAHAGDINLEYQLDKEYMLGTSSTYKTIEYVESELKQLVDQIVNDKQSNTTHTTKSQ